MSQQLIFNEEVFAEYKASLQANKWESVPNVLAHESAIMLQSALKTEIPWGLIVAKGSDKKEYQMDEFVSFDPVKKKSILDQYSDADFVYMQYRLDKDLINPRGKSSILYEFVTAFNSEKFLSLIREFTGDSKIAFADCRATCYQSGHHLKQHDDFLLGFKRRYAYVLNLTDNWQADWGGVLHLLTHQGDITKELVPAFNVLNIFRVPVPHYVSAVAPGVSGSRYSITGWFYA